MESRSPERTLTRRPSSACPSWVHEACGLGLPWEAGALRRCLGEPPTPLTRRSSRGRSPRAARNRVLQTPRQPRREGGVARPVWPRPVLGPAPRGPGSPWAPMAPRLGGRGVLIAARAGDTHLERELQVDLLPHLADVGLTQVAGDADPGGLCVEVRPGLSAQWGAAPPRLRLLAVPSRRAGRRFSRWGALGARRYQEWGTGEPPAIPTLGLLPCGHPGPRGVGSPLLAYIPCSSNAPHPPPAQHGSRAFRGGPRESHRPMACVRVTREGQGPCSPLEVATAFPQPSRNLASAFR